MTDLVHLATQSEHERLQSTIYILCEGEDTMLAWTKVPDAIPTCFACLAKRTS